MRRARAPPIVVDMHTVSRLSPEGAIRVMLIEDHDHVLWGLMKLIVGEWPRMALAGAVRSVEEAEAALRSRSVDVVVLDIFLQDDNALDRLPRALAGADASFVVLTG